MKVLKPGWVTHDGNPIFSIDIHPDGSRFATGGQGDNSGKVVIWNMAPVRCQEDEENENIPKMLCCMDNHLACVNCVRWSHHGRYLASAGDDKLIMIWQISRYSGPSTVFGNSGTVENLESWRCGATLRGHSGDVLDIAWSENDQWLASCSVDNSVVVWNALKFPEQVRVLKGHTGLVKGVTWDPVGKYLASQSDDKTLRIWRTSDWQLETTITKPFKDAGGTTHVLRLNWSPDGHYLVSAHAMNNRGPTAQIIQREGWKTDLDFVGHRKGVTVVRFNPRILSKKIKKSASKPELFSCCAVGSRDRSVSIWFTALRRPLVVMHDLFANTVLDISWAQTGFELLCCSSDGTVAYFEFGKEELGHTLSKEETAKLHTKLYGKSMMTVDAGVQAPSNTRIIETTAMLKLQQQKDDQNSKPQPPQLHKVLSNGSDSSVAMNGHVVTPSKDYSSESRSKQIETKTPDGRRRITPIFLAPPPRMGDAPIPFGQNLNRNSQEPTFSSTTETSKIVVEKKDSLDPSDLHTQSSQSPKSETKPTEDLKPMAALDRRDVKKANKSMHANSHDSSHKSNKEKHSSEKTKDMPREKEQQKEKETEKEVEKETEKETEKEKEEPRKGKEKVKRKLDQSGGGPPAKKLGRPRKEDRDRALALAPMPDTPVRVPDVEPVRTLEETASLFFPALRIDKCLTVQQTSRSGCESPLVLEIENDVRAGIQTLHQLRGKRNEQRVWDVIFSSRIAAVTANRSIVCAVCEDQTLSLFSTCGRRLCPKLALGARAATLKTNGPYVMTITTKGLLSVWDTTKLSTVIRNETLSAVIPDKSMKIDSVQLTDKAVPIISLSDGRSYTYSLDLQCWLLIADNADNLPVCSDFHQCAPSGNEFRHKGFLASLQAARQNSGQAASSLFTSNHPLKKSATISHLESQMSSAFAVNSREEYHYWLLTYVKYLVQEGYESRLRDVCQELLGPVFASKSTTWDQNILGYRKHELLREILPLIGSNLNFQRLFTEYSEQLDSLMS